jgi:hypothetical protein
MGMAQYHRTNAFGVKGKRFAVAGFILTPSLDHAAVEQQALITHRDQVTGTGHFTGGAKKLNRNCHEKSLQSAHLYKTGSQKQDRSKFILCDYGSGKVDMDQCPTRPIIYTGTKQDRKWPVSLMR